MPVTPYRFITTDFPNSLELSFKEQVDGFEFQAGKLDGCLLSFIKINRDCFIYRSAKHESKSKYLNTTRYDIKWMIERLSNISLDLVENHEYVLGWTTSSGFVNKSEQVRMIQTSQIYSEPSMAWQWIKHVCSLPLREQQRGGVRHEYDDWLKKTRIGRVKYAG